MKGKTTEGSRWLWFLGVAALLLAAIGIGGFFLARNALRERANEEVFQKVLGWSEQGDVTIHSLDAYYHDGKCYYDVSYSAYISVEDKTYTAEVVYFGFRGYIENHFSLEWDDMGEYQSDYEAFLEAVEYGVHVSFTKEEIAERMEEYYESVRKR